MVFLALKKFLCVFQRSLQIFSIPCLNRATSFTPKSETASQLPQVGLVGSPEEQKLAFLSNVSCQGENPVETGQS